MALNDTAKTECSYAIVSKYDSTNVALSRECLNMKYAIGNWQASEHGIIYHIMASEYYIYRLDTFVQTYWVAIALPDGLSNRLLTCLLGLRHNVEDRYETYAKAVSALEQHSRKASHILNTKHQKLHFAQFHE